MTAAEQLDAALDVGDLDEARRLDVIVHGSLQCERCGCTDNLACRAGCSWATVHPPVCTECAPAPEGRQP